MLLKQLRVYVINDLLSLLVVASSSCRSSQGICAMSLASPLALYEVCQRLALLLQLCLSGQNTIFGGLTGYIIRPHMHNARLQACLRF